MAKISIDTPVVAPNSEEERPTLDLDVAAELCRDALLQGGERRGALAAIWLQLPDGQDKAALVRRMVAEAKPEDRAKLSEAARSIPWPELADALDFAIGEQVAVPGSGDSYDASRSPTDAPGAPSDPSGAPTAPVLPSGATVATPGEPDTAPKRLAAAAWAALARADSEPTAFVSTLVSLPDAFARAPVLDAMLAHRSPEELARADAAANSLAPQTARELRAALARKRTRDAATERPLQRLEREILTRYPSVCGRFGIDAAALEEWRRTGEPPAGYTAMRDAFDKTSEGALFQPLLNLIGFGRLAGSDAEPLKKDEQLLTSRWEKSADVSGAIRLADDKAQSVDDAKKAGADPKRIAALEAEARAARETAATVGRNVATVRKTRVTLAGGETAPEAARKKAAIACAQAASQIAQVGQLKQASVATSDLGDATAIPPEIAEARGLVADSRALDPKWKDDPTNLRAQNDANDAAFVVLDEHVNGRSEAPGEPKRGGLKGDPGAVPGSLVTDWAWAMTDAIDGLETEAARHEGPVVGDKRLRHVEDRLAHLHAQRATELFRSTAGAARAAGRPNVIASFEQRFGKLDELMTRIKRLEEALAIPDPHHPERVRELEAGLRKLRADRDEFLVPANQTRYGGIQELAKKVVKLRREGASADEIAHAESLLEDAQKTRGGLIAEYLEARRACEAAKAGASRDETVALDLGDALMHAAGGPAHPSAAELERAAEGDVVAADDAAMKRGETYAPSERIAQAKAAQEHAQLQGSVDSARLAASAETGKNWRNAADIAATRLRDAEAMLGAYDVQIKALEGDVGRDDPQLKAVRASRNEMKELISSLESELDDLGRAAAVRRGGDTRFAADHTSLKDAGGRAQQASYWDNDAIDKRDRHLRTIADQAEVAGALYDALPAAERPRYATVIGTMDLSGADAVVAQSRGRAAHLLDHATKIVGDVPPGERKEYTDNLGKTAARVFIAGVNAKAKTIKEQRLLAELHGAATRATAVDGAEAGRATLKAFQKDCKDLGPLIALVSGEMKEGARTGEAQAVAEIDGTYDEYKKLGVTFGLLLGWLGKAVDRHGPAAQKRIREASELALKQLASFEEQYNSLDEATQARILSALRGPGTVSERAEAIALALRMGQKLAGKEPDSVACLLMGKAVSALADVSSVLGAYRAGDANVKQSAETIAPNGGAWDSGMLKNAHAGQPPAVRAIVDHYVKVHDDATRYCNDPLVQFFTQVLDEIVLGGAASAIGKLRWVKRLGQLIEEVEVLGSARGVLNAIERRLAAMPGRLGTVLRPTFQFGRAYGHTQLMNAASELWHKSAAAVFGEDSFMTFLADTALRVGMYGREVKGLDIAENIAWNSGQSLVEQVILPQIFAGKDLETARAYSNQVFIFMQVADGQRRIRKGAKGSAADDRAAIMSELTRSGVKLPEGFAASYEALRTKSNIDSASQGERDWPQFREDAVKAAGSDPAAQEAVRAFVTSEAVNAAAARARFDAPFADLRTLDAASVAKRMDAIADDLVKKHVVDTREEGLLHAQQAFRLSVRSAQDTHLDERRAAGASRPQLADEARLGGDDGRRLCALAEAKVRAGALTHEIVDGAARARVESELSAIFADPPADAAARIDAALAHARPEEAARIRAHALTTLVEARVDASGTAPASAERTALRKSEFERLGFADAGERAQRAFADETAQLAFDGLPDTAEIRGLRSQVATLALELGQPLTRDAAKRYLDGVDALLASSPTLARAVRSREAVRLAGAMGDTNVRGTDAPAARAAIAKQVETLRALGLPEGAIADERRSMQTQLVYERAAAALEHAADEPKAQRAALESAANELGLTPAEARDLASRHIAAKAMEAVQHAALGAVAKSGAQWDKGLLQEQAKKAVAQALEKSGLGSDEAQRFLAGEPAKTPPPDISQAAGVDAAYAALREAYPEETHTIWVVYEGDPPGLEHRRAAAHDEDGVLVVTPAERLSSEELARCRPVELIVRENARGDGATTEEASFPIAQPWGENVRFVDMATKPRGGPPPPTVGEPTNPQSPDAIRHQAPGAERRAADAEKTPAASPQAKRAASTTSDATGDAPPLGRVRLHALPEGGIDVMHDGAVWRLTRDASGAAVLLHKTLGERPYDLAVGKDAFGGDAAAAEYQRALNEIAERGTSAARDAGLLEKIVTLGGSDPELAREALRVFNERPGEVRGDLLGVLRAGGADIAAKVRALAAEIAPEHGVTAGGVWEDGGGNDGFALGKPAERGIEPRPPDAEVLRRAVEKARAGEELNADEESAMLRHVVERARRPIAKELGTTKIPISEQGGFCHQASARATFAFEDLDIPGARVVWCSPESFLADRGFNPTPLSKKAASHVDHGFAIIELPNGRKYLVDPTFGQYFSPESRVGAELLRMRGGKELADELIAQGHIELTDATATLYLNAFSRGSDPARSGNRLQVVQAEGFADRSVHAPSLAMTRHGLDEPPRRFDTSAPPAGPAVRVDIEPLPPQVPPEGPRNRTDADVVKIELGVRDRVRSLLGKSSRAVGDDVSFTVDGTNKRGTVVKIDERGKTAVVAANDGSTATVPLSEVRYREGGLSLDDNPPWVQKLYQERLTDLLSEPTLAFAKLLAEAREKSKVHEVMLMRLLALGEGVDVISAMHEHAMSMDAETLRRSLSPVIVQHLSGSCAAACFQMYYTQRQLILGAALGAGGEAEIAKDQKAILQAGGSGSDARGRSAAIAPDRAPAEPGLFDPRAHDAMSTLALDGTHEVYSPEALHLPSLGPALEATFARDPSSQVHLALEGPDGRVEHAVVSLEGDRAVVRVGDGRSEPLRLKAGEHVLRCGDRQVLGIAVPRATTLPAISHGMDLEKQAFFQQAILQTTGQHFRAEGLGEWQATRLHERMEAMLDAGLPVFLAVEFDGLGGHQLLVQDKKREGGKLKFLVYEPNWDPRAGKENPRWMAASELDPQRSGKLTLGKGKPIRLLVPETPPLPATPHLSPPTRGEPGFDRFDLARATLGEGDQPQSPYALAFMDVEASATRLAASSNPLERAHGESALRVLDAIVAQADSATARFALAAIPCAGTAVLARLEQILTNPDVIARRTEAKLAYDALSLVTARPDLATPLGERLFAVAARLLESGATGLSRERLSEAFELLAADVEVFGGQKEMARAIFACTDPVELGQRIEALVKRAHLAGKLGVLKAREQGKSEGRGPATVRASEPGDAWAALPPALSANVLGNARVREAIDALPEHERPIVADLAARALATVLPVTNEVARRYTLAVVAACGRAPESRKAMLAYLALPADARADCGPALLHFALLARGEHAGLVERIASLSSEARRTLAPTLAALAIAPERVLGTLTSAGIVQQLAPSATTPTEAGRQAEAVSERMAFAARVIEGALEGARKGKPEPFSDAAFVRFVAAVDAGALGEGDFAVASRMLFDECKTPAARAEAIANAVRRHSATGQIVERPKLERLGTVDRGAFAQSLAPALATADTAAHAFAPDVSARLEAVFGRPISRAGLEAVFCPNIPGWSASVESIETFGEGVSFAVNVRDADGRLVARISRDARRETDGHLVVRNVTFDVDPAARAAGLGTALYAQAASFYDLVTGGDPRTELRLLAGNDVGVYAWARDGFDFADDESRRAVTNAFIRWVGEHSEGGDGERYFSEAEGDALLARIELCTKPWELAAIELPNKRKLPFPAGTKRGVNLDNVHAGKAFFLLGAPGWEGVQRPLSPEHKAFEAALQQAKEEES
ncbi:MAG: hypothetical protein IT381_28380 [Deltaproteobacteria bacterium]|nr:hypothetical protein [Deltaproteobacteria bacterium]